MDNDKADEEQCVDQQTGHEQPIDDDHHHFLGDEQPHNEQPDDEELTSFINLVDSTSGSSDVILTHASIVEDDVTKNSGIGWQVYTKT